MSGIHFKDEVLDRLARTANVAQFVSFDPQLTQRYAWLQGFEPNHRFAGVQAAVSTLIEHSPEASVNIRTFAPAQPKSHHFVYGLTSAGEVVDKLHSFGAAGLTTIVNETVDVADGGVSGVAYGSVVEFAPGDTPRCVEKPGTAAFPRDIAMRLFQTVYGFSADLPGSLSDRVEFSLHPIRRGYRRGHTIVWEVEATDVEPGAGPIRWPNRFSRHVGDKAFGLLVGTLLDVDVPATTVIPRRLAPFSFGSGGTAEPWLRTCPTEQVPGKFTTRRGWIDPFALLAAEDPNGDAIASILCQRGIDAVASGAALEQRDGTLVVEGVRGFGDEFMVGARAPESLPEDVTARVRAIHARLTSRLGPVRFEWADDGSRTWLMQLHCGRAVSSGQEIVPGHASTFRRFDVRDGLEALRRLIEEVKGTEEGIAVIGQVGITSHFGDVLRKAGVPSRLEGAGS